MDTDNEYRNKRDNYKGWLKGLKCQLHNIEKNYYYRTKCKQLVQVNELKVHKLQNSSLC